MDIRHFLNRFPPSLIGHFRNIHKFGKCCDDSYFKMLMGDFIYELMRGDLHNNVSCCDCKFLEDLSDKFCGYDKWYYDPQNPYMRDLWDPYDIIIDTGDDGGDDTPIVPDVTYYTVKVVPTPSNATVTINGIVRSSASLEAGTTVEIFVSADGYVSKSVTLSNLTKDETINVNLEPVSNTYLVNVTTIPNEASVSINGTTTKSTRLAAGTNVQIIASLAGYYNKTYNIPSLNKDTNIEIEFTDADKIPTEPGKYKVTIVTIPNGDVTVRYNVNNSATFLNLGRVNTPYVLNDVPEGTNLYFTGTYTPSIGTSQQKYVSIPSLTRDEVVAFDFSDSIVDPVTLNITRIVNDETGNPIESTPTIILQTNGAGGGDTENTIRVPYTMRGKKGFLAVITATADGYQDYYYRLNVLEDTTLEIRMVPVTTPVNPDVPEYTFAAVDPTSGRSAVTTGTEIEELAITIPYNTASTVLNITSKVNNAGVETVSPWTVEDITTGADWITRTIGNTTTQYVQLATTSNTTASSRSYEFNLIQTASNRKIHVTITQEAGGNADYDEREETLEVINPSSKVINRNSAELTPTTVRVRTNSQGLRIYNKRDTGGLPTTVFNMEGLTVTYNNNTLTPETTGENMKVFIIPGDPGATEAVDVYLTFSVPDSAFYATEIPVLYIETYGSQANALVSAKNWYLLPPMQVTRTLEVGTGFVKNAVYDTANGVVYYPFTVHNYNEYSSELNVTFHTNATTEYDNDAGVYVQIKDTTVGPNSAATITGNGDYVLVLRYGPDSSSPISSDIVGKDLWVKVDYRPQGSSESVNIANLTQPIYESTTIPQGTQIEFDS